LRDNLRLVCRLLASWFLLSLIIDLSWNSKSSSSHSICEATSSSNEGAAASHYLALPSLVIVVYLLFVSAIEQ
jgi:hypothetical protein